MISPYVSILSWIGERILPEGSQKRFFFENGMRAFLVALTAVVALVTPYFGTVLGTVGGFTDATVSFVLPPLIFLKLTEANKDVSQLRRYFIIFVFVFGVTLVAKTTYAIAEEFASMIF